MRKLPKTKMVKMDISLYEEFKNIAATRFAKGLDKKYSPPTVQRKTVKHPLWEKIKKDLEIAQFLKDDLGQFTLFRFVVVAFLAVLFFGGLIWVTGILNDTFLDIGLSNEVNSGKPGYVNLTEASEKTFGQMNNSIQALRLVAITLIFSEILLFFVLSSFRRVHPAFFIVYVLIVFLAVMLAAPVSNAYESILQTSIYDGTLHSFTGANWILLNLPLITLIVGIFGSIFMFINILRSGNEEAL